MMLCLSHLPAPTYLQDSLLEPFTYFLSIFCLNLCNLEEFYYIKFDFLTFNIQNHFAPKKFM